MAATFAETAVKTILYTAGPSIMQWVLEILPQENLSIRHIIRCTLVTFYACK